MRIILYILILALLLLAPVERLDVAKLLPVEAVAVYMDGSDVVLETDTENLGRGETAEEALEDLKKNTAAIIYLDTAEYLLVGEGAKSHGVQLKGYLKASVIMGDYSGGSVKDEAKYLDAHSESAKPVN